MKNKKLTMLFKAKEKSGNHQLLINLRSGRITFKGKIIEENLNHQKLNVAHDEDQGLFLITVEESMDGFYIKKDSRCKSYYMFNKDLASSIKEFFPLDAKSINASSFVISMANKISVLDEGYNALGILTSSAKPFRNA